MATTPESLPVRLWILLVLPLVASTALCAEHEGFTEPFQTLQLTTVVPGQLASLDVREGDHVKIGQQLAALDTATLEATLAIAKAKKNAQGAVSSATALFKLRQIRVTKLLALQIEGHAREDEIERALADQEVAKANLVIAKEEVTVNRLEYERVKQQIELHYLRSPINGVVVELHKEVAEIVQKSEDPILTLVQLDRLRLTLHLPTPEALSLHQGDIVQPHCPELDATVEGVIELVSPLTNADSGTVRVKILLDNPNDRYRSGVRCTVLF
ncbi:hypothetical protein MNBD_GAMMA26-1452 [hydrothermal vent metagenome]|uniref:Multidrug resistance protein MdtA-like barrel-sandwich hybrid domain-containing protein n=1 Tax=hydrothermal vent metagenome TaxID=652676 RepID=A0A3B1B1B7_9ZZZZ